MVAQVDKDYARTRPWKLWSRLLGWALFEGRPLTTRGRWINRAVFGHYALARALPQMRRVDRPLFILGTGRSGTTILGVVLSMHREVAFLNEPKALWHAAHGGEDLIGSYTREAARYRLGSGDAAPGVCRAMHRMAGWWLRWAMAPRLVDKYPELIFRLPFVRAVFPDARFLFLARNGWDTAASIENWSVRLGTGDGAETHDWWGANDRKWQLLVRDIVPDHADLAPHAAEIAGWTDHRARAALEWVVTMREGLALTAAHPDLVLHVPYERLCTEPDAMLTEIRAFAGLSPDPVFERYGSAVLAPPRSQAPFDLPECLRTPFAETMQALGYAAGQGQAS